jgi:hypothetical protein
MVRRFSQKAYKYLSEMKIKDLTGKKFNMLTVLSYAGRQKWSYFLCKCDCGKEKLVRIDHLQTGKTMSCGCYQVSQCRNRTTHKLSYNRLYFVWASMMVRCYRETFQDFHNYGGRGIKVCDRWHNVSNFVEDMTEGSGKGLQLDRVNNDENYSKQNCKWSTRKENNRNKRTNVYLTIDGITKVVSQWAEETGIHRGSIYGRMHRGLSGKEALYGVK